MVPSTAWVSANTPVRFTPSTLSHSSFGSQRMLRTWLDSPALLTRMSTRPCVSTAHRPSAAASVASTRSTWYAAARPPASSISRTTASSGALRRPATTTSAPSAASMMAAARPMPVPPPVTIATCRSSAFMFRPRSRAGPPHPGERPFTDAVAAELAWRDHVARGAAHQAPDCLIARTTRLANADSGTHRPTASGRPLPYARSGSSHGLRAPAQPAQSALGGGLGAGRRGPFRSLPRPDRLLEVIDARRTAVHDDLAHLIDDGRRRRVDQGPEDGQLDHRPVALRDRDEPRHLRGVEVVERHTVNARHLIRIRAQHHVAVRPDDDRRDHVARACRIVVEESEHCAVVEREADLLAQLPQRGAHRRLAGIDATTGQRPLPRVRPERRRAPGQQEARAAVVVRQQHRRHRGGPVPVHVGGPPLERGQVGDSPLAQRLVEQARRRQAAPSTSRRRPRDVLRRSAFGARYSSESYQRLACSMLGNSSTTTRFGRQSPSRTSMAPPRTRNRPPYFCTVAGTCFRYSSKFAGSVTSMSTMM